jgi:hypothetical protein
VSLLAPASVVALLVGLALPRFRLLAVVASIGLQCLVWSGGRVGSSGTLDGDAFSSLLSLVVLGSLAVALAHRRLEAASATRLLAGGALVLVGVATRDLLVAVFAVETFLLVLDGGEGRKREWALPVAFGVLALLSLGLVLRSGASGLDLADVAAAEGEGLRGLGLSLLAISLAGSWLVHNRRALRFARSVVSGAASSFVLLVLVGSVFARMAAWVPDAGLEGIYRALALAALAVGALGMLGSTRIRTFVTTLALARAGALGFALLGGAHGRAPFLLELVATGVTLLLVAIAVELAPEDEDAPLALDDLASLDSPPSRLLLLVGALSAAPLPPFPGFVARLAATHAVLLEGGTLTAAAAGVLAFLTAVGSFRLVARAFKPSGAAGPRRADSTALYVGLAVALAAIGLESVAPGPLLRAASEAAMGIF